MSNDGEMTADILGLFFGQYNTAPGQAEPSTDLTIKKDDLDRSSEEFVGRYAWKNTTNKLQTLVCKVTIDGRAIKEDDGANVKASGQAGTVDTVLFRWPGSAFANTLGKHEIVVTPGVHVAVFGSAHSFGIGFPSTTYFTPKKFTVTLV